MALRADGRVSTTPCCGSWTGLRVPSYRAVGWRGEGQSVPPRSAHKEGPQGCLLSGYEARASGLMSGLDRFVT